MTISNTTSTIYYVLLALICSIILVIFVKQLMWHGATIDIVISRYNESLEWLKALNASMFRNIIVYNKGGLLKEKDQFAGCTVINLPNVGRCDHTVLYHIVKRYDKLADVTIFLPGSCDMDYKWGLTQRTILSTAKSNNSVFIAHRMENYLADLYDFKLDEWKASNERNAGANPETKLELCPDRPYGKWYEKNFGSFNVHGVTWHGIFSVSKQHIHQRSKESYAQLMQYVDHHSNPEAGHYFERAWLAVFHPVPKECVYS